MRRVHLILLLCCGCSEVGLRPRIPEPAVIPPSPEAIVDRVHQPEQPRADVLWIIDDSCSMDDDQSALAEHIPAFIDWFVDSEIDFHIGLTTTDDSPILEVGRLRAVPGSEAPWIDPDTPDPVASFRAIASVGVDGSIHESGLGAAYLGLTARLRDDNAGFLREDASLHTIVVSDEDDDTDPELIDAAEFVDWYAELDVQPDRRTFSPIVTLSGEQAGHTYLSVRSALGGASADIRADSWVQILDDLGRWMTTPKDTFYLSRPLVSGSLRVALSEAGGPAIRQREDLDYRYDASLNAVVFEHGPPPPGSAVQLDYLSPPET